MARSFSGTAQYLEYAGAALTATPLTWACWFSCNTGITGYLCTLGKSTSFSVCGIRIESDNKIKAQAGNDSGNSMATTTTTISANTWSHAACVFTSSTSRAAFLNGGGKGTDTTSQTPSGLNRTTIGARNIGSYNQPFAGLLAEVGLWNIALSDADIVVLATGISPFLVRPDALVGYWPLVGKYSPEIDLKGRREMTVTGATQIAHPRMFLPKRQQLIISPALVVGQPASRRLSQVKHFNMYDIGREGVLVG